MWTFQGKYTGEAKAYVQTQRKKAAIGWALALSIVNVIIFTIVTIVIGGWDTKYIIIGAFGGIVAIVLVNLVIFIDYRREKQSAIEIRNDGFYENNGESNFSFAFFSIEEIEYYDDFIVVNGVVLQKELLISGDWNALKAFLNKVEERMDTDEPIYQIEEPTAEFFKATVKEKRIYEKFVGKVSVQALTAVYEYFATFILENKQETEYEIGRELYEKIQEGQAGTLVLMQGTFFDFGDGETCD